MKRITIIGGGASGTLLTVNLLRNTGDVPVRVNLIENQGSLARGVAFGTALKGILWESTAIPEIRVQAHKLVLKLLAS